MSETCKRILVTGASGFLGRAVVRKALDAGCEVRALVRPASPNRTAITEICGFAEGDVLDEDSLQRAMADVDVVIHLAFAMGGDADAQMRLAKDGTDNVVEAMKNAGAGRLVLASSFSVYAGDAVVSGVLDESSAIEDAKLDQRDSYTRAKIVQELAATTGCHEAAIDLVVLRPGVIWGRDRTLPFCLGQKLGPVYTVIGENRPVGFTYVENCADALIASAACELNEPQVICNIADAESTTVAQFIKASKKYTGANGGLALPFGLGLVAAQLAWGVASLVPPLRKKLPGILRPAAFKARFPGAKTPSSHAQRILGWSPRLSFDASWQHATGKSDTNKP